MEKGSIINQKSLKKQQKQDKENRQGKIQEEKRLLN